MPTSKPRAPLSTVPVTFALLTGTLLAAVLLPGVLSPRSARSDETLLPQAPATPEALAFFETKIRPVLADNCYSCHGKNAQIAGLRMDSREALLKGGDSGTSLVPGDPEKSLLLQVVQHSGKIKMPQGGKLKDNEIADIAEWIKMGAPWTAKSPPTPNTGGGGASKGRIPASPLTPPVLGVGGPPKLWSLQPVKKPALPAVKNTAWCKLPVDRFVLARLEAKNIAPMPPADKRTLLRRVTYDLTGLPPTLAETTAFLGDKSPDAYEQAVNRLLASPRYGERMARLWLDVARYADTKGYMFQEDRNYPNAYTYRDWVTDAFNRDTPYDEFVVRQLAADRLPPGDDKSNLAALGFLTVGRRFLNNVPDIIDDRIDVTMRGFQGFTVACARCHDHKFDPIPTQDYYSLYSVFASTKETAPEISKQPVRVAMAVEDVEKPGEGRVFKRGNPGNLGDPAPRRFLLALSPPNKPRPEWADGSGRLELARAIASPQNPLTARVFVNRVWRWHFGQGIVRTPSDFGKQGEKPTHPELLDHLASQFVADGWSVKKLHRRIVLSATYQRASGFDAKSYAADPENRLLWRQNRRRLDLEQIRDSLLAASGTLDTSSVGGPAQEMWNAPFMTRRALYGKIDRQNLPQTFRTFDFASPDSTNAGRFVTTVPQQSLYFLNAPLAIEQARTLAELPEIRGAKNDGERVRTLYRRLFGRSPLPDEIALGSRFLSVGTASGTGQTSPWQYGYGAWNAETGRVLSFLPLPHFTGGAYQGGPAIPDPKLNYLLLNPDGGHPGVDASNSVIRRFVAPRDMTVSVSGTLSHDQKEGDGVQAALFSSQGVTVARWSAHQSKAETTAANIVLKRGETLDFVVSPGPAGNGFDSFRWSPTVTEAGGKNAVWSAKKNFEGPLPTPLNRREQYAQALLMTNEFLFVD
ncbi:MAG: PSD1 domain-containing protein [Akkermansiaceae bacterium]|nr:PSD1 domain-containing protein [Armatimonadota bacterium]